MNDIWPVHADEADVVPVFTMYASNVCEPIPPRTVLGGKLLKNSFYGRGIGDDPASIVAGYSSSRTGTRTYHKAEES